MGIEVSKRVRMTKRRRKTGQEINFTSNCAALREGAGLGRGRSSGEKQTRRRERKERLVLNTQRNQTSYGQMSR